MRRASYTAPPKPKLANPFKAALTAGASVYEEKGRIVLDFKSMRVPADYEGDVEYLAKQSQEDAKLLSTQKQERYFERVLAEVKEPSGLTQHGYNEKAYTMSFDAQAQKALPESWLKSLKDGLAPKPVIDEFIHDGKAEEQWIEL